MATGNQGDSRPPWKKTRTGCFSSFCFLAFSPRSGAQMLSVRQSSLCGVPAPPANALMMPCAWGVKPGKSTGLAGVCGQSLVTDRQ